MNGIPTEGEVERDHRILSLLLASHDAIFEIASDGTVDFISPAWSRITGHEVADTMDCTLLEFVAAADAPHTSEEFDRLLSGQVHSIQVECRMRHDRGETVYCELNAERRYAADGTTIAGVYGSIRDVSDEKRIQHEFLTAKLEAERANRIKDEFLANMSHEIRTPLTAILGFTDVLIHDLPAGDSRDRVSVIRRNGRYLLHLLNDILDTSKIEAGHLLIEEVEVCLPELVEEVRALMEVKATEKNLALDFEFDTRYRNSVRTDPTRLRQVLVNLVGNAIKFTESGSVRVIVRYRDCGDHAKVEFDIVDTGIGVPEDARDRLFAPFAQADSSTTRRFGGTGLGLSISRKITQALGGSLTIVDSQPNVGSTFRASVRVGVISEDWRHPHDSRQHASNSPSTTPPVRPQQRDNSGRPELQGLSVLIAEDGVDNQRLLDHILTRAGATVDVVENGEQAVDRVARQLYDVVLMDMQMPILDGYEATEQIRAAGYEGFICAITANAMSTDRDKCLAIGCDDYLTKPIDRTSLIAALATRLPG